MTNTTLSNQNDTWLEATLQFDLPGFLLGEVYGPMQQEGVRLQWTLTDAVSLADDLKQHDGIDADPQEIYDIMMEFDRQDAESATL